MVGAPIDLSSLTVTTDALTDSDVGDYNITPGGAVDPNYTITFLEGVLSVIPAQLTIDADDFAREYADPNPTFTVTTTGLELSDTISDVVNGFGITTDATLSSNIGTYLIVPGGTPHNSNYDVTFGNGLLTVEKADISLIVPKLASRFYGDGDPVFALEAFGLKNGDDASVISATVLSDATPFSDVGTYQTMVLGAVATNYNILDVNPGVLQILPLPLTITADNFTREYGDANPVFTATFDGLAGFDNESVISGIDFSTPATQASDVLD